MWKNAQQLHTFFLLHLPLDRSCKINSLIFEYLNIEFEWFNV